MTEDRAYPLDPSDAVDYIMRDWFTAQGYGQLRPVADAEE